MKALKLKKAVMGTCKNKERFDTKFQLAASGKQTSTSLRRFCTSSPGAAIHVLVS